MTKAAKFWSTSLAMLRTTSRPSMWMAWHARWDVALHQDREDLVCHNDLAPWNLVFGADLWVLIDWGNAGPASREWEIAYALHGFVGVAEGNDPTLDTGRMVALVDGYGLNRESRGRRCEVLGYRRVEIVNLNGGPSAGRRTDRVRERRLPVRRGCCRQRLSID